MQMVTSDYGIATHSTALMGYLVSFVTPRNLQDRSLMGNSRELVGDFST